MVARSEKQILDELVKLSVSRDGLLEWLLANMEEHHVARIYSSKGYILVGIDKPEKD